ncbi:nitronate monooxygenase [Falsiroseomonas sp. E2-1-a20]|uniref:nitronate monooxygenase n=1 Tax=Falsiroseomonas sp. E2-1-a20 TaxID=3239300 RepID=UPI003F2EDDE2
MMPIAAIARERAQAFCNRFGLRAPILLAPMAGSSPPSPAAAVASAGGMGGFGALMASPDAMRNWAAQFRSRSSGSFQVNLWIPDPPPARDAAHEARVREALSRLSGIEVPGAPPISSGHLAKPGATVLRVKQAATGFWFGRWR